MRYKQNKQKKSKMAKVQKSILEHFEDEKGSMLFQLFRMKYL